MIRFSRMAVALFITSVSGTSFAQAIDRLDCVIEPRAVVDLTPAVEGMISEILVSRGDKVRNGTAVAQLDDDIERLQVELAAVRAASDDEIRSQQARLALRRVELDRALSLKKKRVATGTAVEEAEIEVTLTELAVESAMTDQEVAKIEHRQAIARLERRRLTSPVDGVIMGVDAAPGEFAHEQMVIMRIAETDPLHVEVFAPAEMYGQIAVGDSYQVSPIEPIGGEYTASVSVVDTVFDAASGTFGVRLELPNPDGTIPAGVRCNVTIATN